MTFDLRIVARCCALGMAAFAISPANATPTGHAKVDALTAGNYMQKLSPGLNLGNTLEAIPKETSWGNPETTDAFFKAVRAAGFRSIRIPVAWSQYSDAKHQIRPEWLAHVKDVVRKATGAGLYAMVNIHWDGGWMQPVSEKRAAVTDKLTKLWTQIGTGFRDFDDYVLLAGTNEIGVEGFYGTPSSENVEIQNGFNQTFIDAVRATGGKNKDRWLVIQSYSTDIGHALKFNTKLPRDSAKGRLMMEVHYYSPYNFTLNEKSDIWQWGAKATDPKATETWANESFVDSLFKGMKSTFVDKGVPVLLGEYATGLKPKYPGMRSFQKDWVAYITRSAYRHGMVPMYWDIGIESGLFNRTTGARQDVELIKTILSAAK